MSHEVSPQEMEDHFMSPSYYDPEIVKIATDWWSSTMEQRRTHGLSEGPSPIRMLEEQLAVHGITEPVEIAELIIIGSGKLAKKEE